MIKSITILLIDIVVFFYITWHLVEKFDIIKGYVKVLLKFKIVTLFKVVDKCEDSGG